MKYRILLVAHDLMIRTTRATILSRAGYTVTTTSTAATALPILKTRSFDLIVVGRDPLPPRRPIDNLIREKFPNALILKVVNRGSGETSSTTEITDSNPDQLLATVRFMLTMASAKCAADSGEAGRSINQGAEVQP